jgi:hypothetical protein
MHYQICPKCKKYHIPCDCCGKGQIARESRKNLGECYKPEDFLNSGDGHSNFDWDLLKLKSEEDSDFHRFSY